MNTAHPIILYDGVCGLCNRLIQFTLKRDKHSTFRFAALQSTFARDLLTRHSINPDHLDTFYVVTDQGSREERLHSRARAALYVLRVLGGPWRILTVFGVLPTFILDLGYRLVARSRYRLFGKYDHCVIPKPQWKERFIASESDADFDL